MLILIKILCQFLVPLTIGGEEEAGAAFPGHD